METRKLKIDEVRMLAEVERGMDSGEILFVVSEGNRMAVEPEIMKILGLVSGQTVSRMMALSIMETRLERLQEEITLRSVCH